MPGQAWSRGSARVQDAGTDCTSQRELVAPGDKQSVGRGGEGGGAELGLEVSGGRVTQRAASVHWIPSLLL